MDGEETGNKRRWGAEDAVNLDSNTESEVENQESVLPEASLPYYCHECEEEIRPILLNAQDEGQRVLVCPNCREGFIEIMGHELSDESAASNEGHEDEDNLSSVRFSIRVGPTLGSGGLSRGLMDILDQLAAQQNSRNETEGEPRQAATGEFTNLLNVLREIFANSENFASQDGTNTSNDYDAGGNTTRLNLNFPGFGAIFQMPEVSGDYVFGDAAFDRLMTQLMEQDALRRAPPPATQAAIDSLKYRTVNSIDIESKVECSVCKDLFQLDEQVIEVPCEHIFHPDCILPWLRRSGTCPICRYKLNDKEEDSRDN
jgi:hypothetical protein